MARSPVKRRVREPGATRQKLLMAAFEEIYRSGFQAASVDTILAHAGVTKGALYRHFPDKSALGRAVVDEVVRGFLLQRWGIDLLAQNEGDPITALQQILRGRARQLTAREVELGCPLSNLAQEMSPLDERFRRRVNAASTPGRVRFAVLWREERRKARCAGTWSPGRRPPLLWPPLRARSGWPRVLKAQPW